jgi:DNA repair protein SbcD/Mre11
MFRFLHAADLHLDSPLRGLESYPDAPVEQIRAASRRALDNLVELAIAEEVAFLVLAGDVFEQDWKDYHTALFFADRMGRLGKAGIPVYMISGNHDAASVISRALRPPDNVHVFPDKQPKSLIIEGLNVALHGQGYSRRDLQDNIAAGYPTALPGRFNIGLLHTALTGRPGHDRYAPCTLDDLRSKGYQYWALGHAHQREVVCDDPWVVFSGCLQGRHIKEEGDKGASLVAVDGGRVVSVEHRALDVLRWKSCPVDAGGCGSWSELIDTVRSELTAARSAGEGRPLAVRVALGGQCRLHALLQERNDALFEEIATLAAGIGNLWLERVVIDGLEPLPGCAKQEPAAPLAGLIGSLGSLEIDIEEILREIPELEILKSRLPHELTNGKERFDPTDPRFLEAMKAQIGDLLMGRLTRQGEGS